MKRVPIVIIVAIVLGFSGQALGFTLLDGKLEGSLFLRNDSAVRLEDGREHAGMDAGDIVMFRNTAQLELSYELSSNVRISTIIRGWYDAALDFDSDLEDRVRSDKRDRFRKTHEWLRELYVDVEGENWFARIGKQQIVWGESDGTRMADIVNPLDLTWRYFFFSWEDIRIPLWGVDFNYTLNCGALKAIELIYLPGAFEFGFENGDLPLEGTHWGIPDEVTAEKTQ